MTRLLATLSDLRWATCWACVITPMPKVSLVRWMFAFWIGTALAVAGSRLALP